VKGTEMCKPFCPIHSTLNINKLNINNVIILQNKEFTFRGHGGSVDQLCWHASNSDLLSTASGDKSVRIWDARSQKCAAHIITKGKSIK
jgi:WD40 repeat protein